MNYLRTASSALVNTARLAGGALRFSTSGRTPPSAYQSMVSLFCMTGGVSNDAMSNVLTRTRRPYPLPKIRGVLGDFSSDDMRRITSKLDIDGYYVFEQRLPADMCDKLQAFSLEQKCSARMQDGQLGNFSRYPREAPTAVRYDIAEQDIIQNDSVQSLMADLSLIGISQNYLRCQPVADVTGMWWNTDYLKQADKSAAQFWHFDMDRIKWLKFFIYLTDVTSQSGPHSFVAGSHRTGGIPRALLEKGYARLTDEEVAAHFSPDRIVEMAAPRGTVIAEDTRGLHKGKNVVQGDRLMLQLQFSNSLFGGTYPPAHFETVANENLRKMLQDYPRMYENYSRERAQ